MSISTMGTIGSKLISILTDFKKQHLDNSFNLCLEQEGGTIILIVC